MAISFLSRVQRSPKIRTNKRKRNELKKKLSSLGSEYRRLVKSESKRLSRKRK